MDVQYPTACNKPASMTVALDACTIQALAGEINVQQEITANGVAFITLCKDGEEVTFQVCKLADGKIEYTPSNGDDVIVGSIVDVFEAGYAVECEEEQSNCFPLSMVFTGPITMCKADIIALAQQTNPDIIDWTGFQIVVEKLGGEDLDGFAATTCYVKTTGDHGDKVLDGGGEAWGIPGDDVTPLGDQCFELEAGTVAELNGTFLTS